MWVPTDDLYFEYEDGISWTTNEVPQPLLITLLPNCTLPQFCAMDMVRIRQDHTSCAKYTVTWFPEHCIGPEQPHAIYDYGCFKPIASTFGCWVFIQQTRTQNDDPSTLKANPAVRWRQQESRLFTPVPPWSGYRDVGHIDSKKRQRAHVHGSTGE
jgi:hypothetical protein